MDTENVAALVRDFEDRYAAAFNRRDAPALVALFTEGVTIVTEWGDVVTGRATFAQGLERAFAVVSPDIQIENTPEHVLALTPEVIVSHGTSRKFGGGEGEHRLVYTRVLVKHGEQWRLAANHVSEPSAKPDPRIARK
jgi:uncharacterized protein (TIGR02246 family)